MTKNERILIKPTQNGYIVEYEYRQANPTLDSPRNWDYVSEEYIFGTWDEVVAYVTKTPLEVPPQRL